MADDLIHCPSCNFRLRLPPDLYGHEVECPQCRTRFTAPVPQAAPVLRPPPGREYDAAGPYAEPDADPYRQQRAASAVKVPAILMLVFASLVVIGGLIGLATAGNAAENFRKMADDPNMSPQMKDFFRQMAQTMTPEFERVTNAAVVIVDLIILAGAIQMLRLRTYWLAMAGAILGLLPLGCCCVAQLPISVWGLVVLLRSDVRSSFS